MADPTAAPGPPESLDRLVDRFRCPWCGVPVRVDDAGMSCADGHRLEWRSGYLDASVPVSDPGTRRTLASFGYEWSTFDKVQPEDEVFWRRYFADVPLDTLRDKVVLDAGCGKGRFSFFMAPNVANLVALDGSDAVIAAARNLRSFDNSIVVKADVAAMPFGRAAFDFVWCLGVLHHLEDPEAGFDALVERLAPGGRLLVYLYSRPEEVGVRSAGLAAAALLRRITVRLPHPVLRVLCAPLAVLLYLCLVWPGRLGDVVSMKRLGRLPLQTYRGRPLRSLWLDTFDRLSAPLEKRYVWAEIEPWFRRAGLEVEAVREDAGLIVLARRA